VLTEIGGTVPAKGLYVLDAAYDDPSAYEHWLGLARPAITAILDGLASRAGATS
jgi:FMN reductase